MLTPSADDNRVQAAAGDASPAPPRAGRARSGDLAGRSRRKIRGALLLVSALGLAAAACSSGGATSASASSASSATAGGGAPATGAGGASTGGPTGATSTASTSAGGASSGPGGASGTGGADPQAIATAHHRADAALQALLLSYWSGADEYLRGTSPDAGDLAGYWIFAQAFDALLDGVERTRGARYAGLVETFYQAQNARGWARDYYDDESWMALALVRAFDLTGDHAYLDQAGALFQDIMTTGWDVTCCGPKPGGIWWNRAHTQKATASNLGPVVLGARLAARTGKAADLAFAKKVYATWTAAMVDPATGAVADHLLPDGSVVRWRFTYNEALFIGASVELAKAANDPSYLAAARVTAAYMLAKETHPTAGGAVLSDGSNATCSGDCAQFKGIGYRYLAALLVADPATPGLGALLDASATSLWASARDGRGLFATDWTGPPLATVPLAADGSATMALNLAAERAGPDPDTFPADTWQAEEAVLHHVGLEASHAGFEGWGYVAGWNQDGQWVDFHVLAAAAGNFTLDLRYAAGAGAASRLVFINGKNAVANLAFPATGTWATYASAQATVALPAGASTISVIHNGSLGSAGFLNLDRLRLQPAP